MTSCAPGSQLLEVIVSSKSFLHFMQGISKDFHTHGNPTQDRPKRPICHHYRNQLQHKMARPYGGDWSSWMFYQSRTWIQTAILGRQMLPWESDMLQIAFDQGMDDDNLALLGSEAFNQGVFRIWQHLTRTWFAAQAA